MRKLSLEMAAVLALLARSSHLCMWIGSRDFRNRLGRSRRSRFQSRPARSWWASCSPIPVSKVPQASAAFSPMVPSSVPFAFAARARRALPHYHPGTIRVDGSAICAHPSGLLITPCFRVQKIDNHSFRGSVAGLDFAYCDFYQRSPRTHLVSNLVKTPAATPQQSMRLSFHE